MQPSTSPAGFLNGTDIYKTARGAVIYLLGYILVATLTAAVNDLPVFVAAVASKLPDLPAIDEQQIVYGVLAALAASGIEIGRRLMTDYSK